ncbi:MAG: hypothetical protein FWC41_11625 [Firmicutes bacterium]|nr:hypothetical protein [Bacillota bacterium]
MGTVNFKGGSWDGGGYGKLFTFESEKCRFCDEKECTCGENNFYDFDFENEVFENLKNQLDQVEDSIYQNTNTLYTVRTMYDGIRTYPFRTLLEHLADNNGKCTITIESGYYEGFQIMSNLDRYDVWKVDFNGFANEDSYLENIEVLAIQDGKGCRKFKKGELNLLQALEDTINNTLENMNFSEFY